jgi:hypothetical protein
MLCMPDVSSAQAAAASWTKTGEKPEKNPSSLFIAMRRNCNTQR